MDSTASASTLFELNNQVFGSLVKPTVTIILSWLGSYIIVKSQKKHERLMESYRLYVIQKQKVYNLLWKKLLDAWGKIEAVDPLDAPTYYRLIDKARSDFLRNQLFFSSTVYKDCDDVFKELLDLKTNQTSTVGTIRDLSDQAKKTREENRKQFYQTKRKIDKLVEKIGVNMRKELSAGYDYFKLKK